MHYNGVGGGARKTRECGAKSAIRTVNWEKFVEVSPVKRVIALLASVLMFGWFGVVDGLAAESSRPHRLEIVPFTAVHVEDSFWSPRIRTNRERSIPHNLKWCEETGRISNFAKAAGLMEGKFEGIYFNDSDVYKVLEGASYALAQQPDPVLEKEIDRIIHLIAAAQRPDGYLNTYYTLTGLDKRWTNLPVMHELYCAGHLFEGAVAHYRATGKREFLDVAIKLADHIDSLFGPNKRYGVPGHEEIELALVKLYEVTGEKRYFELAKFFIDERGNTAHRTSYGPYCQDHLPVRQQSEIVGHAVRAMYLYSGVADVAAYTGDSELMAAMDRIWKDVTLRKMYITGGIGARHEGEAFGEPYELPNESAYCETCAAIGLVFWAYRLGLMHGDAQYADVLERALYNGVLSGVALDGEHFFYVNPLASSGNHHRQPFFACACCPTNVVRLIPSVPGYVYAVRAGNGALPPELFVNLYIGGLATITLGGDQKVVIRQETRYPWEGRIRLVLSPERETEWVLRLRIPGWCRKATLAVNDGAASEVDRGQLDRGYYVLRRTWKKGDSVTVELAMPVERIEAHPKVVANRGRIAIQRGPLVYCLEAVDNGFDVRTAVLAKDPQFETEFRPDLLGGVVVIKATAADGRRLTAIPYHLWDHREPGPMVVWIRQAGKPRHVDPEDPSWEGKLYRPLDPASLTGDETLTVLEAARPTASHCWTNDSVEALNDGIEPKNSNDHSIPRFTWWDHRGTKEWVQYEWDKPVMLKGVRVYWFDDEPRGGHCRLPASWRIVYRKGNEWIPVGAPEPLPIVKDGWSEVSFDPIQTQGLRLEVQLRPNWSGGILEWQVTEAP